MKFLNGSTAGLGDRPGVQEGLTPEEALAFARASILDFEGVFWVNCRGRSHSGLLGDIAHALGLRLTGPADRNREALREFCATRRCLFVFADLHAADRELVRFGGKTSIIFTTGFARRRRSPGELMPLFGAWPRAVDECSAALGDAQAYLREIADDGVAAEFGSAVVGLLKHLDRLAEAEDVLAFMAASARRHGDPLRARQFAWERSWIAEQWGYPVDARQLDASARGPAPEQLSLFSRPD